MTASRRRLGLVMAAIIAVLAVFVAAFPFIQDGGGPGRGLSGPSIVPRPVVIALLLALPAGVAAIATLRGSRALLVAAGVVCLLQSLVGAFSGVTLGFVVPGIVLMALGPERAQTASASRTSRRAMLAGAFVFALGIAAWFAPFALSETVCWVASTGPDGSLLYRIIPNSDTLTLGINEVASGCDGGTFTLQGLMLGGVLAIGALALAALGAGTAGRGADPPEA